MIEAAFPVARWTVIVPFYNEHVLLPVTLHSLTAQSRQTRIIPVDNGSNDGSGALAEATCRHLGLDHLLVTDHRPGKVFALD
ncbi:MAG: glycosyltransferase, partial [Sandarakinorhabdus sp.]|nr:glycosyltransferase [Sandarakinorhabdus sp.]